MALFKPFRALGCITADLPFAIQRRGKDTFLHVSVGRAWQVYNTAKLTLSLIGPEMDGEITALACQGDITFAAVAGKIEAFKRLHRCGTYEGHGTNKIIQMLVLGDLLLSLSADGHLVVWTIGDYDEPQAQIDLGPDFQPTCMAHPDTYLNKIIVGSSQGKVELWNFISGKRLYTFDFNSAVHCLAPSPALDVVGVGLADGRAVLHNLKFDEQVASFSNASGTGARQSLFLNNYGPKQPSSGPCTTISFSTGQGVPLMAAGGTPGVITVWNLEQKRLQAIVRDAHDGPLVSLHFFAGEPRLMSSAKDNSVKQWLFDQQDGSGRLLRFRSGHSLPPTLLRSYGDGNRLLSAGSDRAFRMFSTIQDQQSRELSQGHIQSKAKRLKIDQSELKLPPVTAMQACQVRERDWANVITAHEDDSAAYTWRLQNFCLGEHVLKPAASSKPGAVEALPTPVTSVAISSCGNFGLVGSQSGRVDRYNMQSGLHRGSYSRRNAIGAEITAHEGPVVGVASDAANRRVLTCGKEGQLRTWGFKAQKLASEIDIGCQPCKMAAHSSSSLVAIADDQQFQLKMFDIETGRQVRTFTGHTDRITDMSLSTDGRWLMSSSQDGTFRVWDIPAARVLQVLRLGPIVTSFSLSPAQELLATAHVGERGIYLWANHHLFAGGQDIVPSDKVVDARLPTLRADIDAQTDSEDEATDAPATPDVRDTPRGGDEGEAQYSRRQISGAPEPLSPQLITLSLLPKTQWQNLVHLEAIKERSKPVQPPQKPEAAPFFLPTVNTLARNPVFATDQHPDANPPDSSAEVPGTSLPGWGGTDGEAQEQGDQVEMTERKRKKQKRSKRATEATDPSSRVLQNAVSRTQESEFLLKLRAGAQQENFSEFLALLRSLSPVAVDQQLQEMQVVDLESASENELDNLRLIMMMAETELRAGRSYEHIQALLKAFLNIHSETLSEVGELRLLADRVQLTLRDSWERLSSKMQKVKCLLNFLGNLPS